MKPTTRRAAALKLPDRASGGGVLADNLGRRRRAGGNREHFVAVFGDENGVFPLCGQAAILGDDGPAVRQFGNGGLAGVDHRLNGEDHARFEFRAGAGATVMQYLRFFVEVFADAVTAEFTYDRKAVGFGVTLNGVADVAQTRAGAYGVDAKPHALIGDVTQTSRLNAGRLFTAHQKHATVVAVPTVLDDGDVNIHAVPLFQHLVAGNAVADLVVDRGAHGFGEGGVARRGVVERGGDGALHIDHVFMTQTIELAGGYAGLDERGDVVEHFGAEAAGDAHFLDFFGGFDLDVHVQMRRLCRA